MYLAYIPMPAVVLYPLPPLSGVLSCCGRRSDAPPAKRASPAPGPGGAGFSIRHRRSNLILRTT